MWINRADEPIPTYGMDGRQFVLGLHFQSNYGHQTKKNDEVIFAIWDSVNECFFEKDTGIEVNDRDIVKWWK